MIKRNPLNSCFCLFAFLFLFAACNTKKEVETHYKSPDGAAEIQVNSIKGQLFFSVLYHNKEVISSSPIVMTIDDDTITKGVTVLDSKLYAEEETYKRFGAHATATNHFNGGKIKLRSTDAKDYYLDVRAFNDAVSFRLIVPGKGRSRTPDESTIINVPVNSTVWHHNLRGHYEAVHEEDKLSNIKPDTWIAPPATLKLPGSLGYMVLTEANLKNYSGMAFQVDSSHAFHLRLAHDHPVSYPYELRYGEEDVKRLSKPASVKGDIVTPWRVVMLGEDLNTLVNSDVIFNLNPSPDKKYFPQGMDTEWVRPGRAVWKYLDGGGNGDLKTMKEFSKLAGELGFEHNILEGFWRNWSDDELKELVSYSKKRGVDIWVWKHSKTLRDSVSRHKFLKRIHDLGISGIKVDFFDHEAKEVIDLYQAILKEAAVQHILVDFHGANKPTGESRTWPNELTREAVRGMESRNVKNKARHNTTLPFTRFLAGPAEYTPVHFGDRKGNTTWSHQIASAVILDAPLSTYAAHPQHLLDNPAVDLIKSIPSVWDETIVLPVSKIGKIAAFARRKNDKWFLAVMNDTVAKSINIPLSFLGEEDTYKTNSVSDNPDNPDSLTKAQAIYGKSDTLKINLSGGGGFLARFEMAGQN